MAERGSPLVYLDTNVFIDLMEGNPELSLPMQALFQRLEASPGVACTSEITLAELTAPVSRPTTGWSDDERRQNYLDLLLASETVALIPVSRFVLLETAGLRRSYPMKLPDAIHAATAVMAGCRFIVTRDRGLNRLPEGITRCGLGATGLDILMDAIR
jgi:predicted nucleic acid-binding protein